MIAIPSNVVKELLHHRELQTARKEELHGAYEGYDLVIALDNGMPMEERMVAKAFKSFIKENDLPEVVFHSLRHLSTSLKLVASNGDIKAVQGDTGHAQARMVTEVYAHTFDGNRREIANKLDHLFFSPSADGTGKETTDLKEKILLAVTKRPELLQVLTALTEE